ncbi:cytochrome c maturation protein CcmE [Spongorhabdus nitratireducens]
MHPQRKRRLIAVLLIVLGVALAAGLVLMALKENINLYYSPSQIAAGEVKEGQRLRGGGLVVPGSLKRSEDGLDVEFEVTDNQAVVKVKYRGILPDLFREGQGIVVTGKMENGVINASEVLAKHDENYMPPEVQKAIDEAHPGAVENTPATGYGAEKPDAEAVKKEGETQQ